LAQTPPKPHIITILADDYGWANVGYHRDPPINDIQTPVIDSLVKQGIELDRHYVFKYCSPTRSAILSGRNPIHVNVLNLAPTFHNPRDPVSGFSAIPRNMTVISAKLKLAGYSTHMVGKWDAGMATFDHTPRGRGFDTSLHYFHHANDYWTEGAGNCGRGHPVLDLWDTDHPGWNESNPNTCTQDQQSGCIYEDDLFTKRVLNVIQAHDPTTPLYIYWAPHNVHAPLEVPDEYVQKFKFIDRKSRLLYSAMTNHLDDAIGHVVDALKQKGMWDNSLITFSSDNGGPIYGNGSAGANNYPLRGGKMSNWEGGVRVNAFASGGFIPTVQRGTKRTGLIAGWDWYATYCALAGVDPTDEKAKKASLPPIDSFNLWPYLSGEVNTSPRTEIALGDQAARETEVTGLIQGEWKLLIGPVAQNGWTGPIYPNISTNWNSGNSVEHCTNSGCLFNIFNDPTEHNEVSAQHPEIRLKLRQRIREIEATVFSPDRGTIDPEACNAAEDKYKGYWGWWLP
jgi:arylsulfatase I/J